MPNPITNFKDSDGVDLGSKLITKEYLMSVYPQIANQMITPELWIWGLSSSGQVGDNTFVNRSTPVTTFAGGANWKQVSCGRSHVAAIKSDGTLWTWGSNGQGQLGNNAAASRLTPVTTFAGGTNWKQVSCSEFNTAAIKTDGTLWVWGSPTNGMLGINDFNFNRSTPQTTFAGGTNWNQVSCGKFHTAAIKTDGTLWIWGQNTRGQLGVGLNDVTTRATPVPVTTFVGENKWKQVACGDTHTAAIKTDRTLWTWGSNGSGELGNGGNVFNGTCIPQEIQGISEGFLVKTWKQVSCSGSATAVSKTDGTLWMWGSNYSGGLGNNTTTSTNTPVTTFAGGTNWKQVCIRGGSSVAIKTDGTLWVWGYNPAGLIGTNDATQRNTPVTTFAGGTNWNQVSCGGYQSVTMAAIRTSDNLLGI